MPTKNKKKANKLSTNILNYFAAFTETRFNFRTLINYRWTNNELTLDLSIFQDFQDTLLEKIKTGDRTPISVKNNEHVLTLFGSEILQEIDNVLSNKFGAEYLETCIEREHQKIAEQSKLPVDTEKSIPPDDNAIPLIRTNFVKTHREFVKIIPQFKIGEYIRAEYARQIPKYRVDFLMTFSKGGKEQTLILEYDGVEYHTKTPDIVTKHNFSQEYLDYDISRQIELESYGYRFLRLNKFNLRPGQEGETKKDVLDRFLNNAFAIE